MKITEKHFEFFKGECKKWIEMFHLENWRVYFKLGDNNKGTHATTKSNLNGYVATIFLTKEWDETGLEDIYKDMAKVAKHEVLHILLGRMGCLIESRFVTEDEMIGAEEETVRKLEYIIK